MPKNGIPAREPTQTLSKKKAISSRTHQEDSNAQRLDAA